MSTVESLAVRAKIDSDVCDKCGTKIVISATNCSTCDSHVGYPNVRMAGTQDEKATLRQRVKLAESSAIASGYTDKLQSFGEAIKSAKAVICTHLSTLEKLSNNSQLLMTFYHQMDAGGRTLNFDDQYEVLCNKVDEAMFPRFKAKIHFAVISLNELGINTYGPCHITLKSNYIQNRTTVFEENSCLFYKKHNCFLEEPKGYRAIWEEKHLLAKAKLHSYLNANILPAQFTNILIQKAIDGEDDFIEAHIYGNVDINTFESVILMLPNNHHEKNQLQIIKNNLKAKGVVVN
jgi:ribosomal protein L40E